jgi:hypothetical protein
MSFWVRPAESRAAASFVCAFDLRTARSATALTLRLEAVVRRRKRLVLPTRRTSVRVGKVFISDHLRDKFCDRPQQGYTEWHQAKSKTKE